MERKESVTLRRLEGNGVGSLEVGKGGIGNGEGTMGKTGKWERKWKLECFGLERGKERREGEVRIRVGMDFVYCWWMVRCLDPRSALVSHGNVLVWKERFGNEVGGKAGCVAVGVGGWTLDSLIL